MISDKLFMQRVLELAQHGLGSVSPNPLVGCVIVREGKILAEGWHQMYGEAHAEVIAINSIKDKSTLKDCTVYVNLEPCSHTGKTPPCADLLVHHKVKRVVIANEDPNPLVEGKGIQKLKEANIEVTVGVLEKEGLQLNKRFFTFFGKKRPYVILKWAQTVDGFIAKENYDSKWISNEYSRQLVHKWRAEEDGILVGFNTAVHDNPHLTVRDWVGKNPIRMVIDKQLELDQSLHLFDLSQQTICYNFKRFEERPNLSLVQLNEDDIAEQILLDLYRRNIQSVIIEGGTQTINYFLQAGQWDEARVITSDKTFGNGIKAPEMLGELISTELVHGDELKCFENKKGSSKIV